MSLEIVESYADDNMLDVGRQIGFGIHGQVFILLCDRRNLATAAKVFENLSAFERELQVYQRLGDHRIIQIGMFSVPLLLNFDADRLIIEMTVVDRPFCLDFASAYLDELPAYFPPFGPEWHAEKEAQFGSEHWPDVLAAVRELEGLGIYQTDVSPSNIALPKGFH